MNNYRKGTNLEEELTRENIPIDVLPTHFLWMHVKGGTKVSNVVDFARKALDNNEYRHIVWSGSGGGTVKTISCAEIIKRYYKPVYQITRLGYQNMQENWVSNLEELEDIVVKRQVPTIHILTSLDPIEPKHSGFQVNTEKSLLAFRQPFRESKSFNLHDQRNPRSKNATKKPRSNKAEGQADDKQNQSIKKKKKPAIGKTSERDSLMNEKD